MTPRVGLYTNLIAIHYSIVLDCIVYMGVLTEPNTRLSGSFHTHTHRYEAGQWIKLCVGGDSLSEGMKNKQKWSSLWVAGTKVFFICSPVIWSFMRSINLCLLSLRVANLWPSFSITITASWRSLLWPIVLLSWLRRWQRVPKDLLHVRLQWHPTWMTDFSDVRIQQVINRNHVLCSSTSLLLMCLPSTTSSDFRSML